MARRKKKNKFKKIITLLFCLALLAGGVFLGVKALIDKTDNNISNEDSKDKGKVEVPKVKIVDENSKSRPYAVMINNLSAARPYHTGLQDAYLVYEIVVEGGITRYMALFKDNLPEVVGSVRSARHYFLDYALENDAYYVHWGWSPQAQNDINTLKVENLNGLTGSTPYFFRQKLNVSSEHTAYVNLAKMGNLVNQKKYRTETNKDLLLNYSATPIDIDSHEERKEAKQIDLKFSNGFTTNYVYDEESSVYKQSVNGQVHKDYKSGEQYTVKNIITYKVANKTISGDNKGRQDIQNVGKGEGYYITNGVAIPITWEKKSRSAQTVYKYSDGTEITVNDGNTWIHIVPNNGSISIS